MSKVLHRMPTNRRQLEKTRTKFSLRFMTIEDEYVALVWNGDEEAVALVVAMTTLAVERLDDIVKHASRPIFGWPIFEEERMLLLTAQNRFPNFSELLAKARQTLIKRKSTPIAGKLPSEDEIVLGLFWALRHALRSARP